MTTSIFLQRLVRQLRQFGHSSDAELLERFQTNGDPEAFATIVRRYGGCVLSTCRKVLSSEADAEDAFQATFVVLLQNAKNIRQRQALGGWLCGVAHRVALKALTNAARRQRIEQAACHGCDSRGAPSEEPDLSWREACVILHEELDRLPDKYRLPLLLCYLEGKSRDEAAQQLGVKLDVLRGRLASGREKLRGRLTKRGVALSAGLLAVVANSVTAGGLPERLLRATLEAAATGRIPATVAALVHGVTPFLTLGKFKLLAVAVLLLGLVSGGVGLGIVGAPPQPAQPQRHSLSRLATAAVKVSPRPEEQKKDDAAKDEETKTVVVGGVVLAPDGKPCAGAKLFVPRLKKPVVSQVDFAAEQVGTTGADGRFRIAFKVPAKRVRSALIAHADGFGVNWVEVRTDQPTDEATLKLVKDQPITGRVLDTEGKPVAGVTVRIAQIQVPDNEKLDSYLTQWKQSWVEAYHSPTKNLYVPNMILGTATTDGNGQFKLAGAGVERIVKVVIQGRGVTPAISHVLTRLGFDPKSYNEATHAQTPALERSEREMPILSGPDATIIVRPGKVVEGVVRERESGNPLPGIRVSMSLLTDFDLGKPSAVTDADGKYRLEGLPPQQTYEIYAEPPDDSSYLRRQARSKTTPGLAPVRIDLELVKGVVVSGRILDKQTGKGVEADVRVVPLPENKHSRQPPFASTDFSRRSTDREGRFRMVTIPGKSLLFVETPSRFRIDDETWMAVVEKQEYEEELCPYVMADPDPTYKSLFYYDEAWGFWRLASAFGPLGQNVLRFRAVRVLDLKEDEGEVKVELPLERGRTVKVLVQDADGKPLTGVRAGGVTANLHTWHRLKDESAVTVYALDPSRPRQLVFLHSEKKLGAVVTLRGDEKEAAVVKLAPLGTVTGRLLNAEGTPAAGIWVSVVYREPIPGFLYERQSVKTDEEGRFTVPAVLPGKKFQLQIWMNFKSYTGVPPIGFREVEAGKTLDLGERILKLEN
jgi:RNA polymerase sigma factor (sigma-70 family)